MPTDKLYAQIDQRLRDLESQTEQAGRDMTSLMALVRMLGAEVGYDLELKEQGGGEIRATWVKRPEA